MEVHLLTTSILHCPEIQALVPLNVLRYLALYPSTFVTFTEVHMCSRTAFAVPHALAAASSVPLVNPSPFYPAHALWLCVQVRAKRYRGPRAMPQPPLPGCCQLSIDHYPFKAATHGKTSMFLLESSTVAQKAVAVWYNSGPRSGLRSFPPYDFPHSDSIV